MKGPQPRRGGNKRMMQLEGLAKKGGSCLVKTARIPKRFCASVFLSCLWLTPFPPRSLAFIDSVSSSALSTDLPLCRRFLPSHSCPILPPLFSFHPFTRVPSLLLSTRAPLFQPRVTLSRLPHSCAIITASSSSSPPLPCNHA